MNGVYESGARLSEGSESVSLVWPVLPLVPTEPVSYNCGRFEIGAAGLAGHPGDLLNPPQVQPSRPKAIIYCRFIVAQVVGHGAGG